jgi:hypothetical protein|tara:strand:- start:274 stop:681 length:408 start_codon:yes stop_codon:yes gene_type:complete
MRTMTATERAYVAGIVDGEGSIEYVQRNVIRHDRPGKPVHKVWNIRMEVPQVDGRLIDYLIETTAEGTRDMKRFPNNDKWQDQHRWRVAHRGVYRVLKQIHKYLIVKGEKSKLVVDHYDKIFSKKVFGKGGFGVR